MRMTSCFVVLLVCGALLVSCGSRTTQLGTASEDVDSKFFAAIASGDLEEVKLELADNSALLNQPEGRLQQTPLHKAVKSNQLEVAQFLIESGALVNAPDVFGRTPLAAALDEEGDGRMIQLLRESGADD